MVGAEEVRAPKPNQELSLTQLTPQAALEGREYHAYGRPNPVDHLGNSAAFLNSSGNSPSGSNTPTREADKEKQRKKKKREKLRADMIKRVDVPVRVNEMNVTGWLSDKAAALAASSGEQVFTDEPETDSSLADTPAGTPGPEEREEEIHERPAVPFTQTPTRTA